MSDELCNCLNSKLGFKHRVSKCAFAFTRKFSIGASVESPRKPVISKHEEQQVLIRQHKNSKKIICHDPLITLAIDAAEERVENQQSYHVYVITVCEDKKENLVFRRFCDFADIRSKLKDLGYNKVSDVTFPNSQTLSLNKQRVVQERQRALEDWCIKVFEKIPYPYPREVQIFLGLKKVDPSSPKRSKSKTSKKLLKRTHNEATLFFFISFACAVKCLLHFFCALIVTSFKAYRRKTIKGVLKAILSPLWPIPTWIYSCIISGRFVAEIFLIAILILILLPRLLGLAVTWWLRECWFIKDDIGSFQMEFELISLRFGWDPSKWVAAILNRTFTLDSWGFRENAIVVTNFVWKNPKGFETDYFIKIARCTLTFNDSNVDTIYRAVMNPKEAIHVAHLEIDGAEIYLEKTAKGNGLNLWGAVGVTTEEKQEDFLTTVYYGRGKEKIEKMKELAEKSANKINELAKKEAEKMREKMRADAEKMNELKDKIVAGAEKLRGDAEKLFKTRTKSVDASPNSFSLDETGNDSDNETYRFPESNTIEVNDDIERSEHGPGYKPGWGYIPYLFELDRCTVRDLQLHAQDYFNSQHTKDEASTIEIWTMNLGRQELTKRGKKLGDFRRGVFLDELVQFFLRHVVKELLNTNKLSMITILGSATSNQITTKMADAGGKVSQSMNNAVFAIKEQPKDIMNKLEGAGKHLVKVLGSPEGRMPGMRRNSSRLSLYSATENTSLIRDELLDKLKISRVRVRIIKGKNISYPGGQVPSNVTVSFGLVDNQNEYDVKKTKTRAKDNDNVYEWHEIHELGPINHIDVCFDMQVWESKLIGKDILLSKSKFRLFRTDDSGGMVSMIDIEGEKEFTAWQTLYGAREDFAKIDLGQIAIGLTFF